MADRRTNLERVPRRPLRRSFGPGLPVMPTAQWLTEVRREAEAATLMASAPMAFRETRFPYWESTGEVTRAKKLADQPSGHALGDGVGSLDELFWLVAGFVGLEPIEP